MQLFVILSNKASLGLMQVPQNLGLIGFALLYLLKNQDLGRTYSTPEEPSLKRRPLLTSTGDLEF